jgi:signal transduction histidine kinase
VAFLAVVGSQVSLRADDAALRPPGWLGLALLVGGALALTFREVGPVPVLAATSAASLAYQGLGYRPEPLPIAVLIALYTVAVARGPLISGGAAAVYLATFLVLASYGAVALDDDTVFTYLVSGVAAVTVGYGVALGRTRATLAEQRAGELAREQDDRTQAAVAQEQARIAREVHDIIAHDVSVIVAQARAARRVFEAEPQTAVHALASIETVGRDALDGLRRLVGLLRTEPDPSGRSPQPDLQHLPQLLAQVQRAGLPVELAVRGKRRPLPATLELNAYRIVQEALTNSLKHAGPTHAEVVLDYGDDGLSIEVRDHGHPDDDRAATEPTSGYGLISMQQRAAMLGGHLDAGPQDGRGFRVSARFPVTPGVQ